MSEPAASVILATYNQPRALALALEGYARQTASEFEIVVADDGSRPETRALVAAFDARPTHHVWQEDEGFRKARILNAAFRRSHGGTLIFSDGDCIPPSDFVEQHLAAAGRNTFCVGGYVPLTPEQSGAMTAEAVRAGTFETDLLRGHRFRLATIHIQNMVYALVGKRNRPKVYGCNLSVDRETFVAINGFDENFDGFGKEDSDLRNRLVAISARPVSLWLRCTVFHLHPSLEAHPRGPERSREKAEAYYRRANVPARCDNGLVKGPGGT